MLLLIAGWRIVSLKEQKELPAGPGIPGGGAVKRGPSFFWKRLEGDHVGKSYPNSPTASAEPKDVNAVPEMSL